MIGAAALAMLSTVHTFLLCQHSTILHHKPAQQQLPTNRVCLPYKTVELRKVRMNSSTVVQLGLNTTQACRFIMRYLVFPLGPTEGPESLVSCLSSTQHHPTFQLANPITEHDNKSNLQGSAAVSRASVRL